MVRSLAIDWYDGPISGVLRLDNPDGELAFQCIAERRNPDGPDLRLAITWPVQFGTIETIEAIPWLKIGGVDRAHVAIVGTDHPGRSVEALEPEPDQTQVFVAYSTGHRVLAAWISSTPITLTEKSAESLLAGLTFEQ